MINSLTVNLGSLIANMRIVSKVNCELIKYVDLNLEVKVAIIASKSIHKGESIKLSL